ncbi:cell division protein FtsL [Bacillus sp. FJAT-49711]|uniref:cell division protein FtsL n=1 Tax=Bacillus sp. FJAT-49711 TaxID=2833585 RepID=UPI001BC9BA65|nr:cell division protein FtsL [Bacillus sp. FJAT-49711]MBS4217846.1 cell division protein FtsL [Bacillus sp. FJAT-49711]
MSNLARKHYQQHIETQQPTQVQVKTIRRHAKITPGEKFLSILLVAFVIVMAVQIISAQTKIYEVNKNIEDVKSAIFEQQKINGDLESQVKELSSNERVMKIARKSGLDLDENNVRVVENK